MDQFQKKLVPSKYQWLQFLKELSPTTHKADVLTTTNRIDFDKLYVCATLYSRVAEYCLYNIDLSSSSKDNEKSIHPLQPMLRYREHDDSSTTSHGCVVVGSKMFFISGYDYEKNSWVRGISWYDFSGVMQYDYTTDVEKQCLTIGPPMKSQKLCPIPIVVGGTRIIVFHSLLYQEEESESWGPPNFEVFNTQQMTWTELPEIMADYSECNLERIRVTSFCVEQACFIVCTDIGIYGVNVDDDHPKWVKMKGIGRVNWGPFEDDQWMIVGENICNPYEVMGWGKVETFRFALETDGKGALSKEMVENDMILCGAYGKVTPETSSIVLSVNVAKLDRSLLKRLKGDVWKTVQIDKASMFEIRSVSCQSLALTGCWFQSKESENESEKEQMEVMNGIPFKYEDNGTNKSKDEEMGKIEDEDSALEDKKVENSTRSNYEDNGIDKSKDDEMEKIEDEDNALEEEKARRIKVDKRRRSRLKIVDAAVVLGSLIAISLYATIC